MSEELWCPALFCGSLDLSISRTCARAKATQRHASVTPWRSATATLEDSFISGFKTIRGLIGCPRPKGGTWAPNLWLFGVFGEELLRRDQAFAELEVRQWEFGLVDDLFKSADDGDGVHVIEEADVGNAEELALHLALAVGDDGGELGFEALDDDAGVGAFRGEDGGGCGGFMAFGGEELEAECRGRCTSHGGAGFSVVD